MTTNRKRTLAATAALVLGSIAAQGQAMDCAELGLDEMDWLDYPANNPLPAVGTYQFTSTASDTVTVTMSTTDADTSFTSPTDPRARFDGSALDGWDIVNAGSGNVTFPNLQYSAVNTAAGDLVRFQLNYEFSQPTSGVNIILGRFNKIRNTTASAPEDVPRTRIIATAYNGATALAASALVPINNFNRNGRTDTETLGWDLEYNDTTGELTHANPNLLPTAPINTDWLLLGVTETVTRIVFDVVDCTCVDNDLAFRIGVGRPDGRVRQGRYHGLISNSEPDTYNTGDALFEVDNNSQFSAKFRYDGVRYRFGGAFDFDGTWSGMATSPDGSPITLDLDSGPDLSGNVLAINGTLTGVHGVSQISSLFCPYAYAGSTCVNEHVGDYTALIEPGPAPGETFPQGTIPVNGQVQPDGRMGFYLRTTDGTPGFAGGYVGGLDQLGFHANTNSTAAAPRRVNSIHGGLVLRMGTGPVESDFDGDVTVYKTDDTTATTYYPDGYTYVSSVIGAEYVAPASSSFPDSGVVVDGGVVLNTGITTAGSSATLSNTMDFRSANFLSSTGEIFGTYYNAADSRKKRAYAGVIYQTSGDDFGEGFAHGARIAPPTGTPEVGLFFMGTLAP